MGRKKAEETIEVSDDFSEVTKLITKDYGNVVISGDALFTRKRKIIPITPSLDYALGGGIPEGSWVVVTGLEKLGKTSMLLQAAQNAQQPEFGEKHVIYMDAEARLKEMNLNSYKRINRDKFHLVVSAKGQNPLTSEDFLNIGIKYLKQYPECFMIIDSVSALCEKREREGGVGTETRGGSAKLVAQFVRDMAQVVNANDSIMCMVTHVMANTSGKGAWYIEKTANELKYQVDVKIKAVSKEIVFPNNDKENKAIGQKINWLVEYNALGMSPNQQVQSFLRYGDGLDEVYDWIEFGISLGLITVAEGGGWHTLNCHNDTKVQGRENLRHFLVENPESLNNLRTKVQELLS